MSEQETYDEEARALTKALFAPDEPDEPEPDEQQKPPNYVAREGNSPKTHPDGDMAMRELARDLFDRDPNA